MLERTLSSYISRNLSSPVVLVGMMGAGKTHLGRALAKTLDLKFIDSDYLIESRAGQSVASIFKNEGESAFRSLEAEVIQAVLEQGPVILSTGGGALINPKTLESVKEKALSIWVQATLPDMLERVSRNENRPLLQNVDPAVVLSKLLNERKHLYEQADIQIMNRNDAGPLALEEILQGLAKALKIS